MLNIPTKPLEKSSVTSCRGCCFAQYHNKEQVDCAVRPMKSDEYFMSYQDGESYRVYDGMCQFKRAWTGDLNELVERVKSECRISYTAFIEYTTDEDTAATVRSLNNQALKPKRIVVVTQPETAEAAFKVWNDTLEMWADMPDWRDQAIQKYPDQLYTFVKAGFCLPIDYFDELNRQINFNRLRFGAIESNDLLIVPNGIYQMCIMPLRAILENLDKIGANYLDESFSPKKRG